MRSRKRALRGSMTLEASFVLPLFIFFFVNVMALFNITEIQSQIEGALHQAGSELSLMAFDLRAGERALSGGEGNAALEAVSGAGGILIARENMRKDIGERIDKSIVTGGFGGLGFLQSKVMAGNDIIDLVVDYRVHPPIPVIGFREIPIEARYYGHAWTGYDLSGGLAVEDPEEEMVYVTEHGEAYHRDIDCVHLRINVQSVDFGEIPELRNDSGSRYLPCEYCGQGIGAGSVFITGSGSRYHSTVGCRALKRSIYTVPISEVGGRHPCAACG